MHESGGSFKISSYLQEMLCHVGQNQVFEDAAQTMEHLRGVEVDAKQIERVCHYHGEQLESELARELSSGQEPLRETNSHSLHYAMMDGSMILTREDGWKEVKLGRIFCARDNIEISSHRGHIMQSQYIAHVGGHERFLEKFDYHLEGLTNVVFVGDGARWIWNWTDAFYPDSIQILDFYHAKEHLCSFAQMYFKEESERKQWIEQQTTSLTNDMVEEVIRCLIHLSKSRNKKEKQARQRLINYYTDNTKRMRYKTFREQGLLIGSGAIESAHRTIIQQRLKLSGQRWTCKGAQQVINLRIANKSNQWNKVVNFTKKAA